MSTVTASITASTEERGWIGAVVKSRTGHLIRRLLSYRK